MVADSVMLDKHPSTICYQPAESINLRKPSINTIIRYQSQINRGLFCPIARDMSVCIATIIHHLNIANDMLPIRQRYEYYVGVDGIAILAISVRILSLNQSPLMKEFPQPRHPPYEQTTWLNERVCDKHQLLGSTTGNRKGQKGRK